MSAIFPAEVREFYYELHAAISRATTYRQRPSPTLRQCWVQLFANFFHALWLETQALASVEMHHESHRPTSAAYHQSMRPARYTQDVHVITLIDWGPLSKPCASFASQPWLLQRRRLFRRSSLYSSFHIHWSCIQGFCCPSHYRKSNALGSCARPLQSVVQQSNRTRLQTSRWNMADKIMYQINIL